MPLQSPSLFVKRKTSNVKRGPRSFFVSRFTFYVSRPRQQMLRHADAHQNAAEDQRGRHDDSEALSLESQVHEIQGHERSLDRRESHETDDQRRLVLVRKNRGVTDLD